VELRPSCFEDFGSGAVYTQSKQVKYICIYWQSCCCVRFHRVANVSGSLCSKQLLLLGGHASTHYDRFQHVILIQKVTDTSTNNLWFQFSFAVLKCWYWLIMLEATNYLMFSILEGGCPHFLRTFLKRSDDVTHKKIWQAQEQCTMQLKEHGCTNEFRHSSAVKHSLDFFCSCF
jgi:hypothetical protein